MKIGVSSYSYNQYMSKTGASYFEAARLAREAGFDGIEFLDMDIARGEGQATVEELAKTLRDHCAKLGIEICAYTIGADFVGKEGGGAKEAERVMACTDVAALLGAPVMRHDVAWGLGKGMRSYRDVIEAVAPHVRKVSEYAKTLGVRTCTENHGYLMQDSHRVEELMLAVGCDNYGWLIDMGNFACADERSDYAVGIAAPYAFHVHAKDFLIKPGSAIHPGAGWFPSRGGNHLRGTIVGHGDIPVAQCISLLKQSGYDGYVSLEFEGMEDNLPAVEAGLAYLRRVIG